MQFFRRSAPKHEPSTQALGPSIVADPANARVDIVFLHGLTGHRERTWTATGQDEPWPKSLLPKDLPTARIITYGYDADVVNLTRVAGQNTVREHATNLINDLAALRSGVVGQPIIFVAHSLGGLVCQDALLVCNNPSEDAQSDILSSTRGIAFLGTPHAGSGLKQFAAAVANIVNLVKKPNKKLLEVLGKNSDILANIEHGFSTIVKRRDRERKPIELHAFIEELPVDYLGCRVVEPDSAKIRGYNFDSIHANHMEMTKFHTASDPGYTKVLNRLKFWIGDDSSSALHYSHDLLLKFETLWPGVELAKSEPPTSAKQLCISSNIEPSLKWFMDSPEYRNWKDAYSPKLWLHGEHGDGKTVIMSYILKSLFRDTPHADKRDFASIFCSNSDSEEGVVASIAFQLLQNKGRSRALQTKFPILNIQSRNNGLLLWDLLTTLITAGPVTTFIIDGIDKLKPSVRSSFLDKFGGKASITTIGVRVLISSANDDDIQRALSHYQSIDRENERRECLETLAFQEWNAREIGVQEVEAAGSRFFRHPEYYSWAQSDCSSVLWLEGKPGSGKSTLAKFMVKELENDPSLPQAGQRNPLQERTPSHNSPQRDKVEWIYNNPTDKSTIIARFYYSFRGGNTQTNHELMLRSIVYQIWSKNSRLFPLIRKHYRMLKDCYASERISFWSYNDLMCALESLCGVDFDLRTFIIVDGMDESNNDRRVDILKFLLNLALPNPKSSCIFNIFITSRPENNINSGLRQVPHHIKLQEVNEEDIRMVVGRWIRRMVSEDKCKEEILQKVKEYIMEHSHGVFMWVTLVQRDLEQHIDDGGYSNSSLDTRLRSLPKELGGKDGFYRAMVNLLVEKYKENQEQQERGRRILAWVTFAERPISVTELQDALATPSKLGITDFSTYVLEDNRPHQLDKAILSSCGGLAEIRDSNSGPIVQLIHQTAREFLLYKDKLAGPYYLEQAQGDMEIAMACFRYISIVFRPDFAPAQANAVLQHVEMLGNHLAGKPLLVYALVYFQRHLDHLGSNNEKIRDEFMSFVKVLIERSNSYASLLLGQWIQALKWPTKLRVDETLAMQLLHSLLSRVEVNVEVVKVLLSLRSDLLHIEAGKGHLVTMRRLLENDPHCTPQSIGESTKFSGAHSNVGLLLLLGANAGSKDTAGRTPLSYAAENCDEGSLRRLITASDNNSKDKAGRTPLSYAAENGHEVGVRMLLIDGADRQLDDAVGRTPLSYAAEKGHEDSVKLLLDRVEVDANLKDSTGRTPLSYATANGHIAVVELLKADYATI